MKISIVVPCFNEDKVIKELIERLKETLTICLDIKLITKYEIIFIDDGSSDNTLLLLRSFSRDDERIKVVSFSRNFGQQIAITAGIDAADGDAMVIMDADLQDPPELIPEMIKEWNKGYKIIHMKRKQRIGESGLKKFTAKIFYRLLNKLTTVEIPLDSGDFKLLDKEIILYLRKLTEHFRFMRGLEVLAGFSQLTLEYDRPARFAGKPKYSFLKSFKLAVDGITSFSSKPLKMVTVLGIIGIISSFILMAYAMMSKIMLPNRILPGWTSLLIVVVFFSSIQLFSLGLIGEYIGRIYEEVKGRPLYVIKDKINL